MKKIFLILLLLAISPFNCILLKAKEAKISFTGDIIMHIPVKSCSLSHNKIDKGKKVSLNNRGFDFLFEKIKNSLLDSDIVVGNMEFPISPPFRSKPKIFNCHPDILPALKKSGFTMMHIANNHILDQGAKGIRSTIKFLHDNKLDFIGVNTDKKSASRGVVKTINGIRIGFIGYAGVLNYPRPRKTYGYYINWFYDSIKIKKDIKDIKKRCDYLVMIVHTGYEYALLPHCRDKNLMRKYINYGVDLIVGHHPHLLQPVEKIISKDGRICYIFYSLGNFISNQSGKKRLKSPGLCLSTRNSVIVNLFLSSSDTESKLKSRFEILPIRTVNKIDKTNNKRVIQTVAITDEIISLNKRFTETDKKEKKKISRKLKSLYNILKAIKEALLKNQDIKEIVIPDTPGN